MEDKIFNVLKDTMIFRNNRCIIYIVDSQGNNIFPHWVSNKFSTDGKKIFITMHDCIDRDNYEKKLDNLLKYFWPFKKRFNVVIERLDMSGSNVYSILYTNCTLKKYHGTNLTFEPNLDDSYHLWYLEIRFGSKKIITDDGDYSEECPNEIKNFKPLIYRSKYEKENIDDKVKQQKEEIKEIIKYKNNKKRFLTLKNSNKMLDEAIENVVNSKKINKQNKTKSIQLITEAKIENEKKAKKEFKYSLNDKEEVKNSLTFDWDKLEKDITKQIADLENNNI